MKTDPKRKVLEELIALMDERERDRVHSRFKKDEAPVSKSEPELEEQGEEDEETDPDKKRLLILLRK